MFEDFRYRLRALFHRNNMEVELDEELRFHIDHEVEKHMMAGMTNEEAHRRARIYFGGQEQVKENCREARGIDLLETFVQDVRYALRQLWKTPGFTITAVLTLALGIGANAAIFTLVNAVLLKNLPVTDPKTLVHLGDDNACCVGSHNVKDNGDYTLFPTEAYEQLRKNTPEFADLAAMQAGFAGRPIIARSNSNQDVARSVMGEFVSGNYFHTFGLTPAAGRLLLDSDDVGGAPIVVVMSYEYWQHTYSGDPSIVGASFWVNTKPVTVVGIAPKGFFGDRLSSTPPDFYLPIEAMPVLANAPYVHDPDTQWLYIFGRVKPGISLPALQQKTSAILRQALAPTKTFSSKDGKLLLAKLHITLTPGGAGIQSMQKGYASQLYLLMWVSGLVLLIACANIANLLLVRGMARKTEISLRTALGALRGRIIRQLLTESIVLSVIGGCAGLVIAYLGTRMLLSLAFPGAQNVPIHASPSLEVIAFATALALLTGVLFGVAPSWITSHAEPADALRSGSRTTAGGVSLLQRGLVILQAALSLVLLVGAGLFSQSLTKLQNFDMKLDATNRYIVHINPQGAGYSQTQLEALYRTMEDRFHAIAGVTKVGISSFTPMEDNSNGWNVQVQGQPDQNIGASVIRANTEYFDSVGTRVIMGRGIGLQDTSSAPAVAVINQTLAAQLFKPGENPIGHHIGDPGSVSPGDFEIVGVVADTAYTTYTSERFTGHGMYFIPLIQRPPSTTTPIEKDDFLYAGAIVVQTSRPMDDMESIARHTLAAINPNLSVVKFQAFQDQINGMFSQDRLLSRLTMLFGGLALLLAAIGLYGVTSYTVVRRTSEIGIRMALGAERGSVIAMVMRGAMVQAGVGLAIGIPVALLCVQFVKAQLYDINKVDSGVLAGAVVTLAAAACIAGMIPARRAASVDPGKALRAE